MGEIESSLGGESSSNGDALQAVAELLAKVTDQPAMVTSFVLIVEASDADDRWLFTFTAPFQKRWETMGLLAFGQACENNMGVVPE